MAGQNIKGRGQRPNSLEGGGARYLNFLSTHGCIFTTRSSALAETRGNAVAAN